MQTIHNLENDLDGLKPRLFINILFSTLFVLLSVLIIEYIYISRTEQANIAKVTKQVSEYRAKLEYLINNNLQLTQGISAFISINPDLTQQEYETFAEHVFSADHQVRNIGAAKDLVITHIYPLKGNEKAIGLNYAQMPAQKAAALKAIEVGKIVVAGPLNLVQGGIGLVARQPVKVSTTGKLWGISSIVLDFNTILKEAGILEQKDLNITLQGKDALGESGAVFFGDKKLVKTSSVKLKINLPYGAWIIYAEPKNGWHHYQFHYPLWIASAFLLIIWIIILRQRFKNQTLYIKSVNNLIESEHKFRNVFHDHNAVMLLIEQATGAIVDANQAAEKYYGYTHQQLTNKKIQEINQLTFEEVQTKRKLAAHHKQNFFIFPHKLADGSIRQVEVHSSPVKVNDQTLLFSIIHDVTQRIESEQKLKLDAKVFEHSQEGVLITDANNQVISVNTAFSDITGYSESEVIGKKPLFLSSHKNAPELFREIRKSVQEKGFWKGEIWSRKKDGSTFPELLSISKLEESPNVISHYVAVFSDITKLKQSEERLERLAHYDALTNLPNRLLLKSRINHAIGRVKRNKQQKLGLLFLDLDQFKIVNDSLGHQAGDELLQQVAARLKARVREQDTLARLGGDEFVVLVEDLNKIEDLVILAHDIIVEINKPFVLQSHHEAVVGTSVGITIYPDDTTDADKLLTFADAAMYKAKQNGRNTYAFYTENITKLADRKLKINNQLKKAIENNELELYYQPQVDFLEHKIVGAEALVRWNHPEEGLLSPDAFVEYAEESSVIHDLSKWVLNQGCQQLKSWHAQGLVIPLALNISPRDFSQKSFMTEVQRIIEQLAFNPKYLELELTENTLMERPEIALDIIKRLRKINVSIAIDDFGTGHSSIAYLKHFPINKLKIDRSFVSDIATNKTGKDIVSTIINMAKSFGLQVVAEGVESSEQDLILNSLGCDIAQGYLYSKPLKQNDFEQKLREQFLR
ncbi:EAL domain-containing protein [Catenovulum sp. 2E275]|uniref:bifunctional diguanylate cyclase/phosphodiesterase n=1 Tax=Catenovulum sp. 2E275 TaxID=2980497 RepID=UPI0021CDFF8D|nr:EAL domain-containing protein [Catenovulum sp. 2E275]MCU4676686.1 EAL domain-containing protein [Catenovulum sp. 2E275]